MMERRPTDRPTGTWPRKFAAAWSGLWFGIRTQNSFWAHIPIAILVVIVAAWLRLGSAQWALLILCIGSVIGSELINSSIEELVHVLHPQHDIRIGRSLDMAAAGVLIVSIAAVVVGLVVIGPPLWMRLIGS